MTQKLQGSKSNVKKKLNLTGTIPKGLLSPTNQSNNKHKHSEYFESANTVAYNDSAAIPHSLRNAGSVAAAQSNGSNTVINIQYVNLDLNLKSKHLDRVNCIENDEYIPN